jgi:hypothetical protein
MKTIRFTPLFRACAALALIAGSVSTGISASTIAMDNYNGAGNTISCTGCSGFVGPFPSGPISLSITDADKYDMPGSSNEAAQLGLLNDLLALFGPPRGPVSYVNKTDGDGNSFETNRQYFSIKKSTEMWFFQNLSGGTVSVNLEGRTEDYSNWTEYGVVPVPAAVWLFGTALIGLFGFGKRRKAA